MDRIKLFKLQRAPGEKAMVEVPSDHVADYLERGYQIGNPREIREIPGYARALSKSLPKRQMNLSEFIDHHCLFDRLVGQALNDYARDPDAVEACFERNLYEQRDQLLNNGNDNDAKRDLELNLYWKSCLEIGQQTRLQQAAGG